MQKTSKSTLYKNETFKMPEEIKLTDALYIEKLLEEMQLNIRQGPEYEKFVGDFKKFTTHFIRQVEYRLEDLLHKMEESKKMVVFREASRLFKNEERHKEIGSKVRRVVQFRLEELKRATKEHKWTIVNLLFDQLMRPNMYNKDLLEKLKYLDLPNDLRQKIWSYCLENKKVSDEYRKLYHNNNLLTVSKFDVQIARDCEDFIRKHMQEEAFDAKMIYTMKVILSYFERRQDRILSDYLFYIAIPLIRVYGNSAYMLHPPVDLIGFFFSIVDMVRQIDPNVDFVVQHDEKYDAMMTDLFMNSMHQIDQDISQHIANLLNLDDPAQRNILVSLVKRFIHSLGFEFLSMRVTLFVWDQMIMKVYPMGIEIFLVMAISFLCMKDDILHADTWDNLVDFYYKNAKLIDFKMFTSIYAEKFQEFNFYNPVYDPNINMHDVPYSIVEESQQLETTQVVDYSKKPTTDPEKKKPKVHSTLLKKLEKKKQGQDPDEEDEPDKRQINPQMEEAMKRNLISVDPHFKEQVAMQGGNIPMINVEEEDQDELDDI